MEDLSLIGYIKGNTVGRNHRETYLTRFCKWIAENGTGRDRCVTLIRATQKTKNDI